MSPLLMLALIVLPSALGGAVAAWMAHGSRRQYPAWAVLLVWLGPGAAAMAVAVAING